MLADTPAPPAVKVRAYSHLLGECGVSLFGGERLAAAYRRRFPRSLDGAPFLLPSGDSGLRLSLEDWFQKQGIRPRVVGTFEDSALIDAFGQAGAGLFAMPSAIDAEVRRQYRVRLVGRLDTVRQRFYAITVETEAPQPRGDRHLRAGAGAVRLRRRRPSRGASIGRFRWIVTQQSISPRAPTTPRVESFG